MRCQKGTRIFGRWVEYLPTLIKVIRSSFQLTKQIFLEVWAQKIYMTMLNEHLIISSKEIDRYLLRDIFENAI